jgi:phytoene dehydrogenase-like protein
MGDRYDIVALGAGHNGLVAAAYLAKAGKKVALVERNVCAGGGVVTRELTLPGFFHDQHSTTHMLLSGNPMIQHDELGLMRKFGLEYLHSDVPHATTFADGTTIFTYKDVERTAESISRVSPRDGDAYLRFGAQSKAILPLFTSSLYTPPPSMSSLLSLMDQSSEGRDLLQMVNRSPLDICNELFVHDKVKIHLLRLAIENLLLPDELGAGTTFFLWPGLVHTYGVPQPVGGSGKLTEALVACIKSYGGDVLLEREVRKVLIRKGRACGLETLDGEQFEAKNAVIAAIHPHELGRYIDGLDPGVTQRARRVRLSSMRVMNNNYALNEPLRYKAGPEFDKAVIAECIRHDSLVDFLRDCDEVNRGRFPKYPFTVGMDTSTRDPTRAPQGKGMMYNSSLVPYELEDGGSVRWDAIKDEVADQQLEYLRGFALNLGPDNILARHIDTPLDMERWSPSFRHGDVHGAAPNFYQTIGHRPTADLGQYTVPGVEGLYLVGPFMHPGGGVMGAGRGTAIRMFEDLDLDFDGVAGRTVT